MRHQLRGLRDVNATSMHSKAHATDQPIANQRLGDEASDGLFTTGQSLSASERPGSGADTPGPLRLCANLPGITLPSESIRSAPMIKSHDREKLINAAVFFASNTHYCGKIKLIKLLYLLDFEHFRQTGSSVTGMEYRAWKMGPVPVSLFEEWDALEPDFAEAVEIVPEKVHDHYRERVIPRRAFDNSHFTRRELRVMSELAAKFRDELSRPLVNFTHAEIGPWSKIWDGGRGYQDRIPYTLAVGDDDPNAAMVLAAANDRQAILAAVGTTH